ncbi:ATP-grasp domain-containing protein [Pseudoalteromonas sp. DL2-H2.2]|uniref:ATP-grasp domain-containing protein n=1 Tax=Pseudoalteromonas sp. DL2-H2.2 TaxID=2908889 RepID=UPI001F42B8B8|nr:ATP-grasp domain-containing protein [Pseudoalteromonas sp. DL2-H2.2]MCF2908851.1 ATP-grasp domain-containing protein [Pseudoalteromonas sp. DL2-H2.2]
MMNFLFTCVGRRKYLVDYFKSELHNNGKIVGVDMTTTAPALAACDNWHLVPSVYDTDYIGRVIEICKLEKIDVLISLNDMELPILSKHRSSLEELGVTLVLANDSAIDICSDKYKTYLFCKENNIPVPSSFISLDTTLAAIASHSVNYPLIVKPRWGSASFGLYVVETEKELIEAYNACKKSLSISYLSQFKESNDDVLIQEFIKGKEYGLDIFNDMNGQFKGVVCKEKLSMRAGETDKAMTVKADRFSDFAAKIGSELQHVGNMDCDFLEKEGQLYLLELNPRFGGGYPFSHEAGANLVRALIMSIQGRSEEITIDYEVDKVFAKCDTIVAAR